MDKDKQRRLKAALNATSSIRMEYQNYQPDPDVQVLIQQWIDGELNNDELHDLVVDMIKNKYSVKEK